MLACHKPVSALTFINQMQNFFHRAQGILVFALARETEVGQLRMPHVVGGIEEEILGLHVTVLNLNKVAKFGNKPVCNFHGVQVGKR